MKLFSEKYCHYLLSLTDIEDKIKSYPETADNDFAVFKNEITLQDDSDGNGG